MYPTEKIAQIGCGVVGFAYANSYVEHKYDVTGIDVSDKVIEKMNKANIPCYKPDDIPNDINVSIILLSLPTPEASDGSGLIMDYLFSTVSTTAKLIEKCDKTITPIVVIRSTVNPGITMQYKNILKKTTEANFHIAFQPEFLRAISAEADAKNPWKIILGIDNNEFYDEISERLIRISMDFVKDKKKITIMSIAEAEVFKAFHNFSNSVKISFSNFCYLWANNVNPDINAQKLLYLLPETAESIRNPKYGLFAGAPFGGTCLPKDSELMRSYSMRGPLRSFPEAVIGINKLITTSNIRREMKTSPEWKDLTKN